MRVSVCVCIVALWGVTLVVNATYSGSERDGDSSSRVVSRGMPVSPSMVMGGEGSNRKPLDDLDKVYDSLNGIEEQVQFLVEQIDSVSARMSVSQRKLRKALLGTFLELTQTDKRQNEAIDQLEDHLDTLEAEADLLNMHIEKLEELNEKNTLYQTKAHELWAEQRTVDVRQDRDVITLYRTVKDFKTKLFQVESNKFEHFHKSLERSNIWLASVKKRVTRRMCESGRVSLDFNDTKAEYQYQNWFDNIPQIIWGICGFNFDRDTSSDMYGYEYPKRLEAEAIGIHVSAYSTKTGLMLEGFDLSFGDTSAVTVDICFEACSIGPGTKPLTHWSLL